MKIFSKKKVREIWGWTEQCYYDALLEALSERYDHPVPELPLADLKDAASEYMDDELFRQQVDRQYQYNLRLLSTDKIRLVLAANDTGQIKRAQHTINSLLTELLERAMCGDQEPSRTYKSKNGKAKGKTSKRSNPKTKSKSSK